MVIVRKLRKYQNGKIPLYKDIFSQKRAILDISKLLFFFIELDYICRYVADDKKSSMHYVENDRLRAAGRVVNYKIGIVIYLEKRNAQNERQSV